MHDFGANPSTALKSLLCRRAFWYFQRNLAIKRQIRRQVNLLHTAFIQVSDNPVPIDKSISSSVDTSTHRTTPGCDTLNGTKVRLNPSNGAPSVITHEA